ncbi:MAG: hypothetical protein HY401_05085 [Elusimicrobia bacterium]|nr:hypothetical protein [Elusimicrobiota bacterium]
MVSLCLLLNGAVIPQAAFARQTNKVAVLGVTAGLTALAASVFWPAKIPQEFTSYDNSWIARTVEIQAIEKGGLVQLNPIPVVLQESLQNIYDSSRPGDLRVAADVSHRYPVPTPQSGSALAAGIKPPNINFQLNKGNWAWETRTTPTMIKNWIPIQDRPATLVAAQEIGTFLKESWTPQRIPRNSGLLPTNYGATVRFWAHLIRRETRLTTPSWVTGMGVVGGIVAIASVVAI